jgi:hypothetical protein
MKIMKYTLYYYRVIGNCAEAIEAFGSRTEHKKISSGLLLAGFHGVTTEKEFFTRQAKESKIIRAVVLKEFLN